MGRKEGGKVCQPKILYPTKITLKDKVFQRHKMTHRPTLQDMIKKLLKEERKTTWK